MGIQLGGLASGIDTASLISGLVAAESQPMQLMQKQAASLRGSANNISSVSSALSSLRTALSAISAQSDVASFGATSSDSSIVASASSSASPGSYNVSVTSLATEQRTYSQTFGDHTTALNQSGSFSIQIGSGVPKTISVGSTDTLDGIAAKINGAGIRAAASVFYDGTAYRLQIRGLDTGSANALTFAENGTTLDLNGTGGTPNAGKTSQSAADATATIDGFTVKSATNQLTGAIPGVTLALTKVSSSPATINVAPDTSSFSAKITAVVNAYNGVVAQAHRLGGYGTTKAADANLQGDSTLRQVTAKLSSVVTSAFGSSQYNMLATIGITSNKDGTLSVNSSKLTAAFSSDTTSVQALLGRASGASSGGVMRTLRDAVDQLTDFTSGPLPARQSSLSKQASNLDSRAADQQQRIDRYQSILQKQFSAMETTYSANQAKLSQVQKISSGNG